MKNEKTSKRVAKIAAKVLAKLEKCPDDVRIVATWETLCSRMNLSVCLSKDLKALAASCLTQAPDTKK